MSVQIPECYDPVYQEELRQRQWDARQLRLPKCVSCRQPLDHGRYLDLTPYGAKEQICEECFFRHSRWADLMEEE